MQHFSVVTKKEQLPGMAEPRAVKAERGEEAK
jgi:hypothetical protein